MYHNFVDFFLNCWTVPVLGNKETDKVTLVPVRLLLKTVTVELQWLKHLWDHVLISSRQG